MTATVLPRGAPITIEQALVRCPECTEVLAIVEALGDRHEVVYLWRPDSGEEPPHCHADGVTAWQADRAYTRDQCSDYFHALVDTYTWVPREPLPAPDPIPEPVKDEQLMLEHS